MSQQWHEKEGHTARRINKSMNKINSTSNHLRSHHSNDHNNSLGMRCRVQAKEDTRRLVYCQVWYPIGTYVGAIL